MNDWFEGVALGGVLGVLLGYLRALRFVKSFRAELELERKTNGGHESYGLLVEVLRNTHPATAEGRELLSALIKPPPPPAPAVEAGDLKKEA